MDFWRSLSGMVEVELTSADPAGALWAINRAGIVIYNAHQRGALTLRFSLQRKDHRKLRVLTRKRGEQLSFSGRQGLYWVARMLLKRPVLIVGILLILVLTFYLPTRIYFVEVEGNLSIPTKQIIEKAESCGIGFGSSRREVRSERMKNALLQAIPDLQWAGVNTYGCRAVISVRERTEPEKEIQKSGVSSIIAARDGVIREMTVLNGNPVCKVGQAVKAGQVLISGYTDCGICIRATYSEGEILAETQRTLTAVMLSEYIQRGEMTRRETKYSLIIGKKQINFYKDSGISDASCDKMYSVKYITLPGGFELPVALATEVWTYFDTQPAEISEETAEEILSEFSGQYLTGTMTAGQIEGRTESLQWEDGIFFLRGRYACLEMIGKTRLEENLDDYEQTD